MRIDPNLSVVPITKDTTGPKAKTATPSSGGSTVVTLSAGATSASSAAATSGTQSSTSVEIASRLDRIKSLLAKGDYPVDLDKLASRIVDDDGTRHGRVGS